MDIPMIPEFAEEITLQAGPAVARVAPRRGAIVTGFAVNGREYLYLDRETLLDPKANVRGGIPILFPNAGPLPGERFVEKGTRFLQHGFARRAPWQVENQTATALSMRLPATREAQTNYPYAFDLHCDVAVSPASLRVTLTIANTGTEPLPAAPGWHPYFAVPHARKGQVVSAFLGPAWGRITDDAEFTFAVPFTAPCDITVPDRPRLLLRASPEHRLLQMWSLPGQNYICFEPFVGPNNALNHPDQRLNLAPGETKAIWMEIIVG